MRLLILDNHDSFTYNLVQLVEESRLCKFDVIKNDEIKIEQLQKYNKILISPGPGLPRETANLKQIIDKYHKTKSILGVCLGLQAICEYFGATLYNFNQVFHGLQTQIQILDTHDYIYTGLNPLINVGLYHSWAIDFDDFPDYCLTFLVVSNLIVGRRYIV